jgi:outer membrane protein OmpA-like peptidoglycan-associated protein
MKRIISLVSIVSLASCATSSETGALVGAGGGAAAGAGVGALAGGTKGAMIGALIGGVSGGVSGALIGRYMDEQKKRLDRDLKSGYVEKVGDKLVVHFNGGILFDTDRASLKEGAQKELAEFARILNEYNDTKLRIIGYTDSEGAKEHNLKLSDERAASVTIYLAEAGVLRTRMISEGKGPAEPVASNATAEGRAKNRRVEIHIEADDDLRKADADKAAGRT